MTSSNRLRAAGYVPLPRLWVTLEDMDIIIWMAKKHEKAGMLRAAEIADKSRDVSGWVARDAIIAAAEYGRM